MPSLLNIATLLLPAATLFSLGLAQDVIASNSTDEYEYVIVGSGPGGGTLAANLAREGHSVFLIEAGADHGDEFAQEIPAWWAPTNANPSMTWNFYVEHYQNVTQARRDNKYAYQFDNGTIWYGLDPPEGVTPLGILYPRGSSLGGSAQANAMNFVLPPDADWVDIADLTGDDGFSPENMRKHFVALENNGYFPPGTEGHGFDGYISSMQNNLTYVLDRPGIADIAREGIRIIEGIEVRDDDELIELLQRDNNRDDPSRFHEPAFCQNPVHVDKKRERSGARNLVAETLEARNEDGSKRYPLTVSYNSLASRVLFRNERSSGSSKPKATGVEYQYGEALYFADLRYDASTMGEKRTVSASKEVIVSGGTFNTPQILKLSGIGPREELERYGIDVVVDLPAVGNYLQDHTESGVSLNANIPWPNNPLEDCLLGQTLDPEEDPCLRQWLDGYGPYGEAGTPLSFTFRSSVAETEDVDIYYFGTPGMEFIGFYPGFEQAVQPPEAIGWSVVKAHGRSATGTVELRSADPRDAPIINFNFFEEGGDLDLQAMTEGVEKLLEILNAVGEPYTPYEVVQPIPGLDITQSIADTVFSHHATSSCRMGPKDDKNYCVDSKFRVNGVDGLRVVDGSIFPHTPGAYPVAATFMISQKAFKDIVGE